MLKTFATFAKSFKYMQQKLIKRDGYTERIEKMFGRGIIIALTGQRRVGKSCMMRTIRDNIAANADNNIIYIDKEQTAFDNIRTYVELERYVTEHLSETKDNYLFIDEVQMIDSFEKALLSMQSAGVCEIMITGSNAKMLSGELATTLRGRYIDYHIRGLSYSEFLEFHALNDNDESLRLFMQYGGLPQLRMFGLDNEELIGDYLTNVYNTIVLRDVIERENIRNIPLLRMLMKFISDNIGKQFSANSISKFLRNQISGASTNIILTYLDYLCNAYIIERVNRYNIHGKRLLEIGDSFYFEDLGIRNQIIGGNRSFDIEKVMENAVYRHLVRLGYSVYIGQLQRGEIDFVAERTGSTIYVQVAYLLSSPDTVEREFGNLKKIKDNHHKYVVSMDPMFANINDDGIMHINLRRFLQMQEL